MNGSLCGIGSLIEADTAHFHHDSKGGQHETDDEGEAEDNELQQHRQWSASMRVLEHLSGRHQMQTDSRFGRR